MLIARAYLCSIVLAISFLPQSLKFSFGVELIKKKAVYMVYKLVIMINYLLSHSDFSTRFTVKE